MDYERWLSLHRSQLDSMNFPSNLYMDLYDKVSNDVFDFGNIVTFCMRDGNVDDIDSENGNSDDDTDISKAKETEKVAVEELDDTTDDSDDEGLNRNMRTTLYNLHVTEGISIHSNVYLIDHMWTTTFPKSRQELAESPQLIDRLGAMLCMPSPINIDTLWNAVWPHMSSYILPSTELSNPLDVYSTWYCLDEVGLSIQHSKTPSFACYPLRVIKKNPSESYTLSIAWPIADVDEGDQVTVDFLPTERANAHLRKMKLVGFVDSDKVLEYIRKHDVLQDNPASTTMANASSYVAAESEDAVNEEWQQLIDTVRKKEVLKIYCDKPAHINKDYIRDSQLQLVDNAADADILYLLEHTIDDDDNEHEKRGKITNQLWCEGMIVSKEQLNRTIRLAYDYSNTLQLPPWYPLTFDLSVPAEMNQFIRACTRDPNAIWISKRYRGRQSIDYPVTRNMNCLLRHTDTAARVVSQYIANPLLYQQKKFDLRYYVIVLSLEPLVVYRHNLFIVRLANNNYSLSSLEEYQTHFTVMNLSDNFNDVRGTGNRVDTPLETFKMNIGCNWDDDVQPLIDRVLKGVFESLTIASKFDQFNHPSGIASIYSNSSWSLKQPNACPAVAMYGVDVLVDDKYSPTILECQFGPDCDKAIGQMPTFWDSILLALYKGQLEHFQPL